MTEFEQQVAAALDSQIMDRDDAEGFVQLIAPRVAAAIDVVVAVFAEEVEGEHGLGRGADGDDYKKAFQAQRAAALAALRGDT